MIEFVQWAQRQFGEVGIPEVRVVDEGGARVSGYLLDLQVEVLLPEATPEGLGKALGALHDPQLLQVTPEELRLIAPGEVGEYAGFPALFYDDQGERVHYMARRGPTVQTGSVTPADLRAALDGFQSATLYVPTNLKDQP